MASDKQIAANRRNARASTGPRSTPGKKRASKNAFRHGLSQPMVGPEFARAAQDLAHGIAGNMADDAKLAVARDTAEAILELDRVRRVEVALVERLARFGRLDAFKIFKSSMDSYLFQLKSSITLWNSRPDDLPAMPLQEPERTDEAVRRALPALLKLQRYKARAAAKRDRAVRDFSKGPIQ